MWFRRDLRLADNPALLEAFGADGEVVALFVIDDRLMRPAGPNRLAFLASNLRALDEATGGRLVVRSGDPTRVVPAVAAEAGAATVHVAADFGPYGRARDAAVEAALGTDGRMLLRSGSPYLVDPGSVRKGDGTPFKVFTPYFRAWSARGIDLPEPSPERIRWASLPSEAVPDWLPTASRLPASGESAAAARLAEFVERASDYAQTRDRLDLDGTSRLSPYLKFGVLHPRQVLAALGRDEGAQRFRTEVAWRDFYADVLWHQPDSWWRPLIPADREVAYDEGSEADARFEAWASGRTGYPVVDAAMSQLVDEGWMHNRGRMIAASFLVKDLHLDWRRGARYFLHHLVDGDLASNNHGWQWVAGTGTDAAPYHRVFNPTLQGERHDPTGRYVSDHLGRREAPPPIVDHADERREALARYQAARAGT